MVGGRVVHSKYKDYLLTYLLAELSWIELSWVELRDEWELDKNEDVGDIDVHDDLIYDIPDEDSILLVQVQGSALSYKTKLVKSFSLTKVTLETWTESDAAL